MSQINNEEFEKVCREEAAAGETVVVGRVRSGACTSAWFPCRANIMVYAGLDAPCEACAPDIQKLRELQGWERQGDFWTSKNLTAHQQGMIDAGIKGRSGLPLENFINPERDTQDIRTSADLEREEDSRL